MREVSNASYCGIHCRNRPERRNVSSGLVFDQGGPCDVGSAAVGLVKISSAFGARGRACVGTANTV